MIPGLADVSVMSELFLLSERQMVRIRPHFPRSHGKPRVDDQRVVSGIIYVIRNGLQWKDAPRGYGPHKTLYNRFVRWSRRGVFERIFAGLAGEGPRPEWIMIDSTHLKAHRTAIRQRPFPHGPDRARIKACIPPTKNRKQPIDYDKVLYKWRHKIETMFARLKLAADRDAL